MELQLYLIAVFTAISNAMYDGYQEQNSQPENSFPLFGTHSFRHLRNPYNYNGNELYPHPQQNEPRFAYQNPIRVAPTLPSSEAGWDRQDGGRGKAFITTASTPEWEPPRTEKYVQTTSEPLKCGPTGRINRQTGRCQTLRSEGSCNENMAFYADPASREYGQCDCNQKFNRPLVYHNVTDKCYFIFQQAYCRPGEWLVFNPRQNLPQPECQRIPRCSGSWLKGNFPNLDWTKNDPALDKSGPVALLKERRCVALGNPCKEEGSGNIFGLVSGAKASPNEVEKITVRFDGINLICGRSQRAREVGDTLVCKPNLFNKWKQTGRCPNSFAFI